jgi:hypothetical protein
MAVRHYLTAVDWEGGNRYVIEITDEHFSHTHFSETNSRKDALQIAQDLYNSPDVNEVTVWDKQNPREPLFSRNKLLEELESDPGFYDPDDDDDDDED